MLNNIHLFQIWLGYLRIVWLYLDYRRKSISRLWWVMPHITDNARDLFGSFGLFVYFYFCNESQFRKMIRLSTKQFDKLYRLVGHRFEKKSLRRPLSPRLRLAFTLQ